MKREVVSVFLALMLILVASASCSQPQTTTPTEPVETPAKIPIPTESPSETLPPTETPSETSLEPSTESEESSPPPELFLDSDGDGFNDWFETNIAGYDPNVPNDRYVIIFNWVEDDPDPEQQLASIKASYEFWTETEQVPPENVVLLTTAETATSSCLENAIKQVAEKSDENDVVLLMISTHAWTIQGFTPSHHLADGYALIDSWLDKINAMVVIASTTSCNAEVSLPVWNNGPCPRIIFLMYGGFMSALGCGPIGLESNIEVDTMYGNGDGYVSLEEIHNWYENDWKFQSPMAEESGEGIPTMLDESNIASEIYLSDYIPYGPSPILENS